MPRADRLLDRLARGAARRSAGGGAGGFGGGAGGFGGGAGESGPASAVTRRAALARAGATLGLGLGAGLLGASPAAADCCGGHCTSGCCTGNPGLGCCANSDPDTCPVCYQADQGDHCCYGTDVFGEAAVWTCDSASVCWQGFGGGQELCDDCTPTGGVMCRNGDCCHAPDYCYTFEGEEMCTDCGTTSAPCGNWTHAGSGTCCDRETETCVDGRCKLNCTDADKCGGRCCPDGQFCCGTSRAHGFCCSAQEADRENKQICADGANTLQDVGYLMVLAAIAFKLIGAPWATLMAKGESTMYLKTAAALRACADGQTPAQPQLRRPHATAAGASFRRLVKPQRLRPVRVAARGKIDPAAARAINAMLTNQAQTQALVEAWTESIARAQQAGAARSRQWATRQIKAAARFAARAAAGCDRDISLRRAAHAALVRSGARELTLSTAQVERAKQQIAAHGLPSDVVAALRAVHLSKPQIEALQAGVLAAPDASLARPLLLAPLVDPAVLGTVRRMAAALKRYSRKASRSPLGRAPRP